MSSIQETAPRPMSWSWVHPILVIAAGLLAYHNSVSGAFLFDDHASIRDNPNIRHLWPVWRAMARPPSVDVAARPLVNLSLAVNYACGRLEARGYHLVNLAIHLVAALLLFGLVRRTLLVERFRDLTIGPRALPVGLHRHHHSASWLALTTALLWVVHPLQTQSVTYVIQRSESLMGVWYLLTLYGVLRGATSDRPRRWYGISVVACGLGMVTKPVMVTAPLMALLYDAMFLAGSLPQAWRHRRGLYLGLMATWGILLAVLTTAAHQAESSAGFDVKNITLLTYAATQPGVILHYLRLALWPRPLVFDYDDWPLAAAAVQILPPVLIIGTLLVATLIALRRGRPLGFLGAWFFLILAPTSSAIPIADVAFEYRMYVPLAAVILLVVLIGDALLGRLARAPMARRLVATALVMSLTLVLASLTVRRNLDYRSEVAMWNDTLAKRPGNVRAHAALGLVLMEQGQWEPAIAHDREALRLKSDYGPAHHNLGMVLEQLGRLDEAAAEFAEALRLKPTAIRHYDLAHVLARQGKFTPAIAQCAEALRLKPGFADVYNTLGNILTAQRRFEEARAASHQALAINPAFAETHNILGVLCTRMVNLDEAAAHYREAMRLKPDYAEAHNNLGGILAQQGTLEEAAAEFAEALRLNPDYREARHNLEAVAASARAPSAAP